MHRGAARLTQEELAERSGLSVGAISLLERGLRTAPRPATIARLAAALKLTPGDRRIFSSAARQRSPLAEPLLVMPPDLRVPQTKFIGRERELADIKALLRRPGTRLLTLCGPPGAGKTRLALEVALAAKDDYPDGVVVVALASVTDPARIMSAVMQAFRLTETARQTPLEAVAARGRDLQLLLVLDNFEHLMAGAHDLVELLDRCPRLQMLVTSQVAMRVRGEQAFAVPPLRLPEPDEERAARLDVLASVPAVALFLDRAGAALPGFGISKKNATAVATICRRLDGLPLALELAAPWVRLLPPQDILDQLDRRLDLLVSGPRDLPERQRTMRATLDWSYGLLDDEPRALLRRLSVFHGSAPLDGLEYVCESAASQSSRLLANLAVLVDHGLASRYAAPGGPPRVMLLESVREYGRELLAVDGEKQSAAGAHLRYYTSLVASFEREARTAGRVPWHNRMKYELDNLRAALSWGAEQGLVEEGLQLAVAMADFWNYNGRTEGLSWLTRLLAMSAEADQGTVAKALRIAGDLASRLGDYQQSVAGLRESMRLYGELGDRLGVAESLRLLGDVAGAQGDNGKAVRLLEDAVVVLRDLGQTPSLATALSNLGVYVSRSGDRGRAGVLYDEALTLYQELNDDFGITLCLINGGHQAYLAGDVRLAESRLREAVTTGRRLETPYHLAAALTNLSDIYRDRGQVEAACAGYQEAMALFSAIDDRPGVAGCVRCLAWGAWATGHTARAAILYGAAEALCPVRVAYDVDDAALHAGVRASLEQQLGAGPFATAYEEGSRLSMREAVAEASRPA